MLGFKRFEQPKIDTVISKVTTFDQDFDVTKKQLQEGVEGVADRIKDGWDNWLATCIDNARSRIMQVADTISDQEQTKYVISEQLLQELSQASVVLYLRDLLGGNLLQATGIAEVIGSARSQYKRDVYAQKIKLVQGALAATVVEKANEIDVDFATEVTALQTAVFETLKQDEHIQIE